METMQKTYPGGVCSRLNSNEAVTSTNEYIYARIYKQFTFWYYKIIGVFECKRHYHHALKFI